MILHRLGHGEVPLARTPQILPDVTQVIRDVRAEGDVALARYANKFGDGSPRAVGSAELEAAYCTTDSETLIAIRNAAERIERFARVQRDALGGCSYEVAGLEVGHQIFPVERVGIYVPGGRYPLPSTALMCAIPARVAGVLRVVMCTPNATRETLAAALAADIEECFEVGGAQAIAAMAYGTQTIPKVDLIVGPGNAHVTAAKRAVYGDVGIDALAGPSELLVIASGDANADLVAADLIAQAEHDVEARVTLITDDEKLARSVELSLGRQLASLMTAGCARAALERCGTLAVMSMERAWRCANELAPEHLALHGARAEHLQPMLNTYGALFVGSGAAEAFADYGAGPNHVLPTGSTARFDSGLSVYTFLKVRTFVRSSSRPAADLIADTARLASIEGLWGHRDAALLRSQTE